MIDTLGNDLEVLASNRNAILLAEVAAWLHMFGKLHEEFIAADYSMDLEIPKDVKDNFPELYKLLTMSWPGNVWNFRRENTIITEFEARELSIFDLIKYHRTSIKALERENKGGFLKLMSDAHGKGSSMEKGVLAKFASEQEKRVYLSTSLGYEAPSFITFPTIYTIRHFFYDFLETFLKELQTYLESPKTTNNRPEDIKKWIDFRRTFLQKLERSFCITVAETRRPLNDVTLLDQTGASVAFFKAAIAQNLLQGWREPYKEKNVKGTKVEVEHKYYWRLLRVGINSVEFLLNSTRIGDILARKKLIEDTLDEIQTLLETKYPLGTEVYRDENGSVFIVPDIDKLHQESYVNGMQSLENYIQNIGYKAFAGETTFTLSLGDSTRNTLSFGNLVAQSITQAVPKFDLDQTQSMSGDICPVCSMRPQGPDLKALYRKICNECERRRINRSRNWAKDLSSTIWIDEVADSNGRLALLVARFDIETWLSGTFFNTILGFHPISSEVAKAIKQDHLKDTSFLNELTDQIREGLENEAIPRKFIEFPLLTALVKEPKLRGHSDRQEDHTVTEFFDIRISGSDLEMKGLSTTDKAKRLTLEMIRLSPSFSRISRVWQTTQTFWKDMIFDFTKTIGRVRRRLEIHGKFIPAEVQDTLGVSHTYELKVGNINLSVIYKGEGEFITADNLLRVASLLEPSEKFNNDHEKAAKRIYKKLKELKNIGIEEPTGYGSSNKVRGTLAITAEQTVPLEKTPYIPAIPILTEPRTFIVLVPADKALDVATAIKEKYEEEMGKVRNRLPLKLGLVFAGRRTPLPAILNAGQRMLNQPTGDAPWTVEHGKILSKPTVDNNNTWTVEDIEPKPPHSSWPCDMILTLWKDDQSLPVKVRTVMGDGTTVDMWYPYWRVEQDARGLEPQGRSVHFTGIDDKEWVHICDLQLGDKVHFMPSRFDFEFLDTAARRFEISYDNGKRRGTSRPARPYYLEQLNEFETLWTILSEGLETTQINNLMGVIETKRMEWAAHQDKTIFERFVRDALNNANWKDHPTKEFEQLCRAAVSGQLADVVELYMHILKTKVDQTGGDQ